MCKVIFEFDSYDDAEELETFQNSVNMSIALSDIYSLVRSELKHGDQILSQQTDKLLEDIKEISGQFM